ncbi:JmjC domain-containing protein [Cupriavidus alkaliphilus]|uniref:JmjC domain-containing protein n=1 Tax=Cupriavidus alkaliphilus TaxID=942866 RepID=UPI0008161EE3|nr:cupin domain-containing protein [Cupriavidus alkaliphilus]SCB25708.1 Cupin superfamily protein [Cupriavidus alkaliphilus]
MKDSYLVEAILGSEDLLRSYRNRNFWKGRIDPVKLQSIFSWHRLNELLATHRITNDRLRLSLADDYKTANMVAFRPGRDQFGRPTDILSISALHQLMGCGVTGVLEATQELVPPLEVLTSEISTRLQARSSANAFFSFGSSSGFGPHNDDHDVIVIQFCGQKHWQFFRTSPSLDKAKVDDLAAPGTAEKGDCVLMQEGDVLFVPKGTWHDVSALNAPSLHVTISIVFPTMSDFIRWLLTKHRYSIPFQDIRSDDDPSTVAAICADFLHTEIGCDTVSTFLNEYYARHSARRINPAFPHLNRVTPGDSFIRLPYTFITLHNDKRLATRTISALGRKHCISELEHEVLKRLSHKAPSTLKDIQSFNPKHGPNTAATIKAIEGLLDKGLISKM